MCNRDYLLNPTSPFALPHKNEVHEKNIFVKQQYVLDVCILHVTVLNQQ